MNRTLAPDEVCLDRRTLSSQIRTILQEKIISGDLLPGVSLSEEALAQQYGVSRAPVREALADLERSGLTSRVGTRDRIILIPTEDLIAEKYDLWWIVDVGRTYLASLEATDADRREIRALLVQMDDAVRAQDEHAYAVASRAFHNVFRRRCSNSSVNDVGSSCDLTIRWFETLYDRNPELTAEAIEEHERIVNAFENRDLPELSESIRVHMVRQRARILDLFRANREATGQAS